MLAFAGLRVEGEVAQVLVVSQPSPLACVAHNIFGETPVILYPCSLRHDCVICRLAQTALSVSKIKRRLHHGSRRKTSD